MPAYAYPIKIKRLHQSVWETETFTIASDTITALDLLPAGNDQFSIREGGNGGYIVDVMRHRKETDAERDRRVAREVAYMEEYKRRNPKK